MAWILVATIIGFKTCDNFNITTADGKNFDVFMAIELAKGSYKGIHGKFYSSEVFDKLSKGYERISKKVDYEYMIWQEWKEGYARFIENLVRDKIKTLIIYVHLSIGYVFMK